MNNPFDYIPSEQMLAEQQRLISHIEFLCGQDAYFREDVSKGKMFGILITEKEVLWAFSGQIGGSFVWPGFVPAVYDYLDEMGYFKVHEREITALNHQIRDLESSQKLKQAQEELAIVNSKADYDISSYRMLMKEAKEARDRKRSEGDADEEAFVRESQFMKAELHRKKLYWRDAKAEAEKVVDEIQGDIRLMKLQRQQKSDRLQRWLFEQFVFEGRNLMQIFAPDIPPSGSGECCEPKLLHYALSHQQKPLEMGMFWWGESPRQEIRHHLQFYSACNGKCKPILRYLLGETDGNANNRCPVQNMLETIYEDDFVIVVNKPSGMLSVPGKEYAESVFSILKETHSDCSELAMVHRLDMDTSGLLVVAKTKFAHKHLQEQFALHTIEKEYVALLENDIEGEGRIELPLRPDFDDRPRQLVDPVYGKEAVTDYHSLGDNLVLLRPHTGRTHQLRVHCAHKDGLCNPIKGDRLYGSKDNRLYLHARRLVFTHPQTGQRLSFDAPQPF